LGYALGLAYQGVFNGEEPLFKLPGNFIHVDQAIVARLPEGTSIGEIVEAE
jgi:hypothetical protein